MIGEGRGGVGWRFFNPIQQIVVQNVMRLHQASRW
jgi:hypothetical protein